jgi:hypothetical protein
MVDGQNRPGARDLAEKSGSNWAGTRAKESRTGGKPKSSGGNKTEKNRIGDLAAAQCSWHARLSGGSKAARNST